MNPQWINCSGYVSLVLHVHHAPYVHVEADLHLGTGIPSSERSTEHLSYLVALFSSPGETPKIDFAGNYVTVLFPTVVFCISDRPRTHPNRFHYRPPPGDLVQDSVLPRHYIAMQGGASIQTLASTCR